MNAKKDFPVLLLSAILSMGYVSASEKPQQKFRFSLSRYETPYLKHHQEHRKAFGRDYRIFKVPGDNMSIIVPDVNKYPMPIIRPGPEWYGDDKFVIKPGPEWSWPLDLRLKEFYKNRKPSRGILLYEWKHK